MIWAGPVRAALRRDRRAGDGNLLQLDQGLRQREIGGQPLTQSEDDGFPPRRLVPDRPDLDSVRPADRQILDEVPSASTGRRLPALAGGRVRHPDGGLLHRRAVHAEHATLNGGAGDALRPERARGPERRCP